MPATHVSEKPPNSSLVFGLQENFRRFWEPPKRNAAKGDKLEGDDELEQVLYAYESENVRAFSVKQSAENCINFRWQSVDQEKSRYTVGQNGIGPSVYKRTYTLFPRPGYRQRKCCGCGPKPTLIVILSLVLLVLTAALIYLLLRSNEKNPVLADDPGKVGTSTVMPNGAEAVVILHELSTRQLVSKASTEKSSSTRRTTAQTTRGTAKTTRKPDVRNTTLPPLTRPSRSMLPVPQTFLRSLLPFIPVRTTSTTPTSTTAIPTPRPFPVIFNPCFPFQCHRNALCQNGTCKCRSGYEGDGVRVCVNIDECVRRRGICGCNANCLDTPGSYECKCKKGYARKEESTKCQDVDECVAKPGSCPESSKCVNVSGGHRCVCRGGLKWNAAFESCDVV